MTSSPRPKINGRPQPAHPGPDRTAQTGRVVLRLATAAVMAISILTIALLWADLRRQQDTLSDARSDNVQWTVGQSLVEYQSMMATVAALENRGVSAAGLTELRTHFDILYNRMDILEHGRLYRHLLDDPEYAADFLRVSAALRAELPLIDASDAALTAVLPALGARLAALEPHLRGFLLDGIRVFAERSTALRQDLTRTMDRVARLSAAMLVVLLGLTAVLFRESRLAEDRLLAQQRSAARLDTILSTSNDAIVVAGLEGRIVEFNGAAECMFGLTECEAHDRMLRSLLQPDTENWHPKRLVGSGNVEMEAQHIDGHRFPVEVTVSAIEIDEGPLLVAFIRDITIRKAAETELIGARDRALAGERAKADFVAVMSHELRTPLNGILGMLALLRATDLTARQRDYIEKMETSGQILLASVDDVLEISRTEAGHVALSPVPTALEPLLRSVADSQSGAAAARGNRIRFTALGDLPGRALVDPGRLRQVLVNLIGNAIKFTQNGDITLEAEILPDAHGRRRLILRVADTGIGIAPSDMGRIFKDFETLDPSLARKQGGAGLGLAIVRRVVEAMEGEIEVESDPGAGSIFTLSLPLDETAEAPAAAPSPAPDTAPPTGARVLVVEDNDVNRAVLRGLLDRRGCAVAEVASGAEGIDAAAAQSFDVILMDLSMPGLDGVEAACRIRAGGGPSAQAPIYAVTAHTTLSLADVDPAARLTGVLTKPLLPAQIDALLARHSPPREPDLDHTHLDTLLADLGAAQLCALLDRFTAEAASETQALAAVPGDPKALAHRAHRLAGAAQNFGARQLAARLGRLDAAASTGDRDAVKTQAAALPQDWSRAQAALTAWRANMLADQTL